MPAKPIPRFVYRSLVALTVLVIEGPRLMPAEDLPTSPGFGFPMIAIASGQTARINALNVGPTGTCGGGVTFEFYGTDGELLKRAVIPHLEPGKAAFVDLKSDDLPKGLVRTEVRAVLRFGYAGGAPPPPEKLRQLECNILPSLEIFENATGRTSLISTDAKLLPAPYPPRR